VVPAERHVDQQVAARHVDVVGYPPIRIIERANGVHAYEHPRFNLRHVPLDVEDKRTLQHGDASLPSAERKARDTERYCVLSRPQNDRRVDEMLPGAKEASLWLAEDEMLAQAVVGAVSGVAGGAAEGDERCVRRLVDHAVENVRVYLGVEDIKLGSFRARQRRRGGRNVLHRLSWAIRQFGAARARWVRVGHVE
jgi:hypothetical protein